MVIHTYKPKLNSCNNSIAAVGYDGVRGDISRFPGGLFHGSRPGLLF